MIECLSRFKDIIEYKAKEDLPPYQEKMNNKMLYICFKKDEILEKIKDQNIVKNYDIDNGYQVHVNNESGLFALIVFIVEIKNPVPRKIENAIKSYFKNVFIVGNIKE